MALQLDAALEYAARGWYIVPIHTPTSGSCSCNRQCGTNAGKHPRTMNGLKDATIEPQQILKWWSMWPDANVGIVTGAISDLVVLDIDNDGDQALDDLVDKNGALPATIESLTGGGGRHLLFAHPGGRVPCSSGKIGRGLDIRADGGYIVAPPSHHVSAADYRWELSSDPRSTELAVMPDWLAALIMIAPTAQTGAGQRAASVGINFPVSKAALQFTAFGAPMGQQRAAAVAAARSFLATGRQEDDVIDAIWRGFEQCEQNRNYPWTRSDAEQIVRDIASHNPTAPGPKLKIMPQMPPTMGEHLTDLGNAKRLVRRHVQDIRYCASWNQWLVWDGRKWHRDDTGEIYRLAKTTVLSIYEEAAQTLNDDERRELIRWARLSESQGHLMAMVELAATEPHIPVTADMLDSDPWLLNVLNGTMDLRTRAIKPYDRADNITKIAPVLFDSNAQAPLWDSFLSQIMGGNENLIGFLRRIVGYSLTGVVSEKAMPILYGTGDNGKTVFINTCLNLLGNDYADAAPRDLLVVKHNDEHPTVLADLMGKRFVATIETNMGRKLDEALVKQLTGRDRVKARRMRQDFFSFEPTWTIFYATNYKPTIGGTDKGIWSRVKIIPFNVSIPGPKQDKHLDDKLKLELSGILNWALDGCMEWQQIGLGEPLEIEETTANYRADMDLLGAFLSENCQMRSNDRVLKSELYARYVVWCKNGGERPESQRSFSGLVKDRGIAEKRGAHGKWLWLGVDFLPAAPLGNGIVSDEPAVTHVLQGDIGPHISCMNLPYRADNREVTQTCVTQQDYDNRKESTLENYKSFDDGRSVSSVIEHKDLTELDETYRNEITGDGGLAAVPVADLGVAQIDAEVYQALLRSGVSDAEARQKARVGMK